MKYISVEQAAKAFGVSIHTIRRRLHKGTLKGRKNGHWSVEVPDDFLVPGDATRFTGKLTLAELMDKAARDELNIDEMRQLSEMRRMQSEMGDIGQRSAESTGVSTDVEVVEGDIVDELKVAHSTISRQRSVIDELREANDTLQSQSIGAGLLVHPIRMWQSTITGVIKEIEGILDDIKAHSKYNDRFPERYWEPRKVNEKTDDIVRLLYQIIDTPVPGVSGDIELDDGDDQDIEMS